MLNEEKDLSHECLLWELMNVIVDTGLILCSYPPITTMEVNNGN